MFYGSAFLNISSNTRNSGDFLECLAIPAEFVKCFLKMMDFREVSAKSEQFIIMLHNIANVSKIKFGAVQKFAHFVELETCCKTSVFFLQRASSIQPRMSPNIFSD